MNILITGGAGFIGSHFVNLMTKSSIVKKIYILDKLTYASNLSNLGETLSVPNIEFIHAGIEDDVVVGSVMKNVDAVVNFAAESHVDRSISDARPFINSNILGVQVLLDKALENGVEKFIQISTDEVYGSIEIDSFDEESPLNPNSPYAASKASADLLVLAAHRTHGLATCITRCSNNYGPNQFPEKLIPLAINRILLGQKIPVYGTGLNVRDWIHVEDHVLAVEKVLYGGIAGEIYNIAGNNELTNLDLLDRILAYFNLDESRLEFIQDRKGHDFRYSINGEKIKNQLGFQPNVDFEVGLNSTIFEYEKIQGNPKTHL